MNSFFRGDGLRQRFSGFAGQLFAWLLRAEAFRKFGYDPDGVFSDAVVDEFGFIVGRKTEILHSGCS
jgi:hypothetical protein